MFLSPPRLARHFTASRGVAIVSAGVGLAMLSQFKTNTASADSPHQPPPKTTIFRGAGPAFVTLPLESAEQVTHDTKRLRFAFPDAPDAVSGLPLTSSLLTLSWPRGSWLPVARPYTPITTSAADDRGHLDLLVKRYPGGKGSTHLHSLVPGRDSLTFAAVLPGPLRWEANRVPRVVLIAGGSGVTPAFQLARGILEDPADRTEVTMLVGANGGGVGGGGEDGEGNQLLLRDRLLEFERRFPGRFRVVYTVSGGGEPSSSSSSSSSTTTEPSSSSTAAGAPGVRRGYIDRRLIEEVAPPAENGDSLVFLCGPPAMEKAIAGTRKRGAAPGILEQMGYRKDQIYTF